MRNIVGKKLYDKEWRVVVASWIHIFLSIFFCVQTKIALKLYNVCCCCWFNFLFLLLWDLYYIFCCRFSCNASHFFFFALVCTSPFRIQSHLYSCYIYILYDYYIFYSFATPNMFISVCRICDGGKNILILTVEALSLGIFESFSQGRSVTL